MGDDVHAGVNDAIQYARLGEGGILSLSGDQVDELDAIASCILGGVGTVFGAMIGSLIMTSLTTGLQIMNVQAAWQYLAKGIVLVLAVLADVYLKKRR